MRALRPLSLAALCALPGAVLAQASAPAAAACPKPAELTQAHMLGTWRAEFDGLFQGATLRLEKHPEYSEGLAGTVQREGAPARVAGDVDDEGGLTLEESADGKRISATWLGDVVAGSCGREIRGTWQAEGDPRARGFVLRKL